MYGYKRMLEAKLFHSKQDYCLKAVEVGALSTAKGVSLTSIL